jgi:hypothetical protein
VNVISDRVRRKSDGERSKTREQSKSRTTSRASIAASSTIRTESMFRVVRDVARAGLWLLTGCDPGRLVMQNLHPSRLTERERRVRDLTYVGKFAQLRFRARVSGGEARRCSTE